MRTKIKVFEALIGTEWKSWQAGPKTQIKKHGKVVSIINEVKTDAYSGTLITEFDLTQIPAHSIGV